MAGVLLFIFGTILAAIVYRFVRHWIRQRPLHVIAGPPRQSFVYGNMNQLFGHGAAPFHEQIKCSYGRIIRTSGFLGDQHLIIADTLALYNILIKNQDTFEETQGFLENNRLVFGKGLIATMGEAHRRQRRLLNPAFSINHMRRIIPVFWSISSQLRTILTSDLQDGPKEIDIGGWLGRLALELIAQAGLGHTFHALTGEHSEYGDAIKGYAPTAAKLMKYRQLLPLATKNFPAKIMRRLVEFGPSPTARDIMGMADTMYEMAEKLWREKKAMHARGEDAASNQAGEGRDIMSILLKANNAASEADRLSEDELIGQMSTFLFAGTDTTSSALSRILYQLAKHSDVQDRLRKELKDFFGNAGNDDVNYDALVTLPYLEAVCRETLRLFAPAPIIQRIAVKDFVLPLGTPIHTTSGAQTKEIFVPTGTTIFLDILGVNRDPELWGPDAQEWNPDRWLQPLPATVTDARIPGVYANTMTFLGGGRACIGFKFSQLEMKVVLAQLIATFRFELPKSKEIVWRFGNIVSPSVKGSLSPKPEMPLYMSLV